MTTSPPRTARSLKQPVESLKKTGLFGDMVFLGPDPYVPPHKALDSPRIHGKQFSVGSPKSGRTPDVYFSVPKTEDAKVSPPASPRKTSPPPAVKHPRQFVPSSPPKSGIWGTIDKFPEYVSPGPPESPRSRSASPPTSPRHQKPGIYTSPGKRGGFGYTGTTFGKFLPMPVEPPKPKKRGEIGSKAKPFVSASHSVDVFDKDAIHWEPPKDPSPPKSPRRAGEGLKPFRPASVPKSGPLGTISQYPEHVSPPPEPKKERHTSSSPYFKPPGGGHVSLPTRSVLEAQLARTPRSAIIASVPESLLQEARSRRL